MASLGRSRRDFSVATSVGDVESKNPRGNSPEGVRYLNHSGPQYKDRLDSNMKTKRCLYYGPGWCTVAIPLYRQVAFLEEGK